MSWFDILKLQRDIFGNPISEKEEAKIKSPSESHTDEEEFPISPYASMEYGKQTLPAVEGHKKPKKSHQKLLHGYTGKRTSQTSPQIRDDVGQTGDETKLNIQQATRQLQRQPRGHYNALADEVTRLGLDSRVNSQQQKKILGQIRRRLEEENIPRA